METKKFKEVLTMYGQFFYQRTMIETESKQLLDYMETLFSTYTEVFLVLSVIVLISLAWLCASELKSKPIASKRTRPKSSNSFLPSYERLMEDSSSIC